MADDGGRCQFTEKSPGLFVCGQCLRPLRLPAGTQNPQRACPKLPMRSRSSSLSTIDPARSEPEPPAGPPPVLPIDREVSRVFAEEEKSGGLGDVADRVASRLGVARVVGYVEREFGIDCHCVGRKRLLNTFSNWAMGRGWTPGAIRVAFLTPTLGLGGAERWILSLCQAWADRKAVSVRAIALTEGAQSWEPFTVAAEQLGVPVLASRELHASMPNAKRGVSRLETAKAALERATAGVDILIHWGIPNIRDLLDQIGWHGPSVSVSHGSGDWTLQMTTQAAAGSNHFAAVSRPSRAAQPPAVRGRTKILWNGIDPDRVIAQVPREETRAAWGLESDDIALGYVGRLSDEKNPLAIADAWRGLGGTHAGRRVVPVWVGDGWLAAKYHRLIAEQVGEAGRVIPATNDIGSVLAALDVYCLASPGEGFSLGLMEAWAAGIPAVSTPVGAVPELEEQFGAMTFRVPVAGSPDDMAAGVRAAIEAGRGSEIVDRAERVTREHFSLRAMGDRWRDWFEEFV